MAFLIANLYKAPLWKRAVVVISAAPVTILINSVRITVTAVLVDNFGIQMAEGFLHEFEGMVVFMVGVLLLVFEIIALENFHWSNVEFESIIGGPAVSGHSRGQVKVGFPLISAVIMCIVALGTITSITAASNSTPAPNREPLVDFPQHIDGWTGHPEELEPETVNVLKATDYYAGDFFETPRGPPINFFVAYYDALNKSAAIHSPRVCLPGSGWEFASFEERKFSELASGASGTYNYVTIQKGQQKTLMYYWYQQRGRRTANEFSMKFYLFVDALFTGRKDGALVRVYTPIVDGEAEANSRLRGFTAALMQKIPAYLPQ
jgi:exosortase D (VPLPA-CTERM-specific)